ncbi:MAG: methyltransferase domain-containing protein [Candidatus Cloacimonetes bacterium]|nr:methyltransferase domain-containing protein [Candidatus Cloacimonadota bacterium]
MAIPIINDWEKYFEHPHEGLGSSYERIILNGMLLKYVQEYEISSILETPSFGFTGLSGINTMALALKGCEISMEDHDPKRIDMIANLWQSLNLPLKTKYNQDYTLLDYPDNSFDMGFNFSALWFTKDIASFLNELGRVCTKLIIICVPNRQGIGYRMQIKDYKPELYPDLHPKHIDPSSIAYLMGKNRWKLIDKQYIDCPPWPDIGMNKELFFKRITGSKVIPPEIPNEHVVSILPYYQGTDPSFASNMLRYSLLERYAPNCFKQFWAHHQYLAFSK